MTRYAVRILLGGQVAAASTIEAKSHWHATQEAVRRLTADGLADTPGITITAQPYERTT